MWCVQRGWEVSRRTLPFLEVIFCSPVLGMDPRASCMLSKYPTTELYLLMSF